MVIYDILFKRYGVRLPQHLMTPIISTLDKFEFPRNSIYHTVITDGVRSGPASDEYLFRNISKQILMDHAAELLDFKGNPRKIGQPILPYIREYHVKNRRYRYLKDMVLTDRDATSLMVMNYGFVPKIYRYIRTIFVEYYKWWNLQKTFWQTVSNIATTSQREQFISISLPKILPSVARLNMFSNTVNTSFIKLFNNPESLFILEIWKWLGDTDRANSTLATLSDSDLAKINIIYKESNNWILINLGVLNSWRYVKGESNDPTQKVKIEPAQLQKRFLRLLMTLMATRAVPIDPTSIAAVDEDYSTAVLETPVDQALDEETKLEKANRTLEALDEDLNELAHIEKRATDAELKSVEGNTDPVDTSPVDHKDFHKDETTESAIVDICNKLADDGLLTAASYRNLVSAASTYKTIKAPIGDETLDTFIKVDPEVVVIKESPSITDISTVLDKSMLKSSLMVFDEQYVEKILAKDVAGMVVNVQKAGVILNNYTVEKHNDILGNYEMHSIRVRPVEGIASTLHFKLPVVDPDGTIMYNNNKYRLRKQRGDLPIRKTTPDTVALTSYYGKNFIKRSNKRVNNYPEWLVNQIMVRGLNASDTTITNLNAIDVFDNYFKCPRTYSIFAKYFKSFTANGYHFLFDHTKRAHFFGQDILDKYETDGSILIATNDINYLVLGADEIVYEVNGKNSLVKGTIESLFDIDQTNAPIEYSEIKIFGKNIPIGLVLAYQLGFHNLLTLLKVEPRIVLAGQRINLENHEYALTFSDNTLIFSKDDKLATMILAGLTAFNKALRRYIVTVLDKPGVYLNLLESISLGPRYLREIDLFSNLFIDPITLELLVEMKEPTTVQGLLVRSSELLLNDNHPDELDMNYMRIKGYERLAGAVYGELVQSVRAHNSKAGKSSKALELHPYAVWKKIVTDPSMAMISDINPIENLKQMEAVTYSGTGGRNSRSMTRETRSYHDNDIGIISESTVDSSNVAVNTFTSADPQFKSLRGTAKPYVIGKTGATALMSTASLLSPSSDKDDPKRVNFVAIQASHGLACNGYKQSSVRTGYEQVLAHRTGDLFAYTARQDGTVVARNNTGIQIEYKDGTKKGIEVGRRFGNAAGLVIPHEVVSDLKAGDTFKQGDIISYNEGFFEKDILNPKQVIWKVGVTVKTVLLESSQTLEDASSISIRLAEKLTTKTTKVKTIKVSFDQIIKNMLKPKDKVEPESILCIIEDAVTSNSNLFDEESLNTLRLLSNQAPAAKVRGVIDRIEVFYHGFKEDMSESLREICSTYDSDLSSRSRSAGKGSINGKVNGDLRLDGEPLGLDNIAIRFYITSDVAAGVGDKGVFCNQMKTVFSEVLQHDIRTESGETIDAVFGAKSINDRIVNSPYIIGTTNTLLQVIGKKAVQLYRKGTV